MFKLAERRGDLDGIYCGPDGLHLGSSPLTGRTGRMFCLRSEREIGALLAAAYDPPPDIGRLLPGFRRVAGAMIAALHLKLGEITEEGVVRLAGAETLLKYGFNPGEPRDWHGRWTIAGGGDAAAGGGGAAAAPGSSAVTPKKFRAVPPGTI